MKSATIAAAALLWTLMAGPALAGGGGGDVCTPRSDGSDVALRDSCLEPITLTAAGDELQVRNDGQLPHDYVAVDGAFDTGRLQPGEETTFPTPAPSVYDVYCTLHGTADGEGMAGTLVVPGNAIGTATAGATTPVRPPEPSSWWALGVAILGLAVSGVALRRASGSRDGVETDMSQSRQRAAS